VVGGIAVDGFVGTSEFAVVPAGATWSNWQRLYFTTANRVAYAGFGL
jgi:hypothetical protein